MEYVEGDEEGLSHNLRFLFFKKKTILNQGQFSKIISHTFIFFKKVHIKKIIPISFIIFYSILNKKISLFSFSLKFFYVRSYFS